MKVKNIIIGIKSLEEMLNKAKDVMKRIEKGERVTKRKPGIYFDSIETMRKTITEERVRILKVIKGKHPSSIYELAGMLNRNIKNVSDDVHYLADIGLVDLKKTKQGREKTTPSVDYDKIQLEIAV